MWYEGLVGGIVLSVSGAVLLMLTGRAVGISVRASLRARGGVMKRRWARLRSDWGCGSGGGGVVCVEGAGKRGAADGALRRAFVPARSPLMRTVAWKWAEWVISVV